MNIPAKLLKTNSQIAVALIALFLYVICNMIFSMEFISEHRYVPMVMAVVLALMAQEEEPKFARKYVLITFLNGLVIFVTAFGFSFVAHRTELKVSASSDAIKASQIKDPITGKPIALPMAVKPTFFKSWASESSD